MLRSKIERAGGTIEWNPVERIATAIIAGQKVVYRPYYDDRISINSKGHIVIDDSYLDKDFSSVVGHLWGDRRLGMSKLDVYSNRMFFGQSLKQVPDTLGRLPGELNAIANNPDFQRGVKNTGIIAVDRTPLGAIRKAYNLIPGVPQLKADEETERALNITSKLKVSKWLKTVDWIKRFF